MDYHSILSTTRVTSQLTQRLLRQKDVELPWRPLERKDDKPLRHILSLGDDEPTRQPLHHA